MRKVFNGIKNLLIGMATTAKHLGRHNVCVQYPTEKWTMPERSRGVVVLLSDQETGELNCTVCMLCARSCPTAAINIVNHKDEATKKRVLDDFIVDYNLCCFCGLCEEACNFAAIKMAPKYEFSSWNKEDMTWHKDKLQEIGRDVPYEKPERKKPAPKPAAPKPADTTSEKSQATAANPNSTEPKTEPDANDEKKPESTDKEGGEEQK